MNRHAPHSAVANDPKPHKPCAKCRKRIKLQHDPPPHECGPECNQHHHVYTAKPYPHPIIRYFDAGWREMCEDCVVKVPT